MSVLVAGHTSEFAQSVPGRAGDAYHSKTHLCMARVGGRRTSRAPDAHGWAHPHTPHKHFGVLFCVASPLRFISGRFADASSPYSSAVAFYAIGPAVECKDGSGALLQNLIACLCLSVRALRVEQGALGTEEVEKKSTAREAAATAHPASVLFWRPRAHIAMRSCGASGHLPGPMLPNGRPPGCGHSARRM